MCAHTSSPHEDPILFNLRRVGRDFTVLYGIIERNAANLIFGCFFFCVEVSLIDMTGLSMWLFERNNILNRWSCTYGVNLALMVNL